MPADKDRQTSDGKQSPTLVSLRKGALCAAFCPGSGGRMTHFRHDVHGDILVPLDDPVFDPLRWPKAGAFPLIPFHNKMTGARFAHGGRRFNLIANPAFGEDAMHGPAQRRAWTVTGHGETILELELRYAADGDWPFDFLAKQRFHLKDDGLDVELALVNTGLQPMPGGLGWHPYFAATPTDTVICDASKCWSAGSLPRGVRPMPRSGREPLPSARTTGHLSDWTHATLATGRVRIMLTADAILPHIVVYRTPAYICLEPVSHVAGVYGFPPETRQDAGLITLEPGQSLSGKLSVAIATD